MPIAEPDQDGEALTMVLDELLAEVPEIEPIIAELRRGFFGLLI